QETRGEKILSDNELISLEARDAVIKSPEGKVLAGPLNFTLPAGKRVVLVGQSGSGKSSLLNALTGFLPYDGSLLVNGVELRDLDVSRWHR
ncbi:ATP-binding cassette domain-containing protein, partial [Klebsiella pneumoniae]|nr:ATP-binding cassette domain-containing protein [Klebsiella pneumoniae]